MSDAEKLEQSDVLKKRAGELFKVRKKKRQTGYNGNENHPSAPSPNLNQFIFFLLGWSLSSCYEKI
jgi:hypothetical protein